MKELRIEQAAQTGIVDLTRPEDPRKLDRKLLEMRTRISRPKAGHLGMYFQSAEASGGAFERMAGASACRSYDAVGGLSDYERLREKIDTGWNANPAVVFGEGAFRFDDDAGIWIEPTEA